MMDPKLNRMLFMPRKLAAPVFFDDERCALFRILPSSRAQIAMNAMLSVLCAFPCPQSWKSHPPFEND